MKPLSRSEHLKKALSVSGPPEDFGYSVALDARGEQLLVGAPSYRNREGSEVGAVFSYRLNSDGWREKNLFEGLEEHSHMGTRLAMPKEPYYASDAYTRARGPDGQGVLILLAGALGASYRSGPLSGRHPGNYDHKKFQEDLSRFAHSIACSSKGTVLVGNPFEFVEGNRQQGAALEMSHHGNSGSHRNDWTHRATLTSAAGSEGGGMGQGVALSQEGDVAAVLAAPHGFAPFTRELRWLSFFEISNDEWVEIQDFDRILRKAEDQIRSDDLVDSSLAMSAQGETVVVGLPHFNHGSVLILRRNDQGWVEEDCIQRDVFDEEIGFANCFGRRVAISGDGSTMVASCLVGADCGAVAVYRRRESDGEMKWFEEARFSLNETGDRFGQGVDLSGDGSLLAVGATNGGKGGRGVVRVFQRDQSDKWWQGQAIGPPTRRPFL